MNTRPYAAQSPRSGLAPWTLERRAPREDDLAIELLHCGVCHTDLHEPIPVIDMNTLCAGGDDSTQAPA